MRGRFIVLDGVEGAGKSTQMPRIADWIRKRHGEPVTTREPGGTPLAEQIRALTLADQDEPLPPMAELLMMFAARSVHLENLVAPALDRGQWVLCDRFVDSSYAYQGAGQGGRDEPIAWLEAQIVAARQPDLVFIFDLPVERVMERVRQRQAMDRFDRADTGFLQRVRDAYLRRAAADSSRYCVIDGAQPVDVVSRVIIEHLEARFA
ncbi:dTMP kinase [uncultured Abyssibacter sp.]|uniref:dTMP kinase n=1 Tax=uncultured Abyssibacter sp. TaxID=2320202 RepID=UPI0032B14B2A